MIEKVTEYRNEFGLPPEDETYFQRSYQQHHRAPIFYGPPKLHKKKKNNHYPTRPVLAKSESFFEITSKHYDYYLSYLILFVTSYLKDIFDLLADIKNLPNLPSQAKLLTSDAVGMYTNIDTNHGLSTIETYINIHQHLLPNEYPTKLVMELLSIVINRNIFSFEDLWFLQKRGTAVGTSVIVNYSILYCALHE